MTTIIPKRRGSLADRIYHSLFSRISNGDYAPNERLPPELKLSEEFGVSRPVLRAAMDRLREEGLIYSRQGAGSYVRAPQSSPVGFSRVETLADIQRCYEFRINLESEAAALAAERHNAVALARIEEALNLLRAATGSQQHREDADFSFHVAIAGATNNQYFEAAMRALREHIHVGMKMHGQALMSTGTRELRDVFEEHSGIFDAVRLRQGATARDLMRAHLEHSRDRLFGSGVLDLRMK
jgi:GntR family transcriptional regulator, transcriptional repressor for pyruvate dehydrogenase complex